MDFSKIKKISFILLILFILLFPFWCVRGLCAEPENVNVDSINGIAINDNTNYFVNQTSGRVQYFNCEVGYIYHITYTLNDSVPVVSCNSTPAENVIYTRLFTLTQENNTFNYIPTSNNTLIIAYRGSSYVTVTREKVPGMNSTINDLVDNVGINSIWNIFDISINYIVVVVLFAFGCYIIFRIIRKISRGKEGL